MTRQQKQNIISLLKVGLTVFEKFRKSPKDVISLAQLSVADEPSSSKKVKSPQSVSKKLTVVQNYINKRIKKGITNRKKLYRELQEKGYAGSYWMVNRYVKKILRQKDFRSYKPSIRFETQPGEQAQVDWASFGKIKVNGQVERLSCFVYILGYSRAAYIEFTIKQNLQTFLNCHLHAFERLGIPQTIVYDNVKTIVLKREKLPDGTYKPHFHPTFEDFSKYYDFKIHLCPPYWPRAKGKVEAMIKYIRNDFMQDMRLKRHFPSLKELQEQLEELNAKAATWVSQTADQRKHGTTGEKPADRFLREKPFLPSPESVPLYHLSPSREVYSAKDGSFSYKGNWYSVPKEFARKKLKVEEVTNHGVVSINVYYHGLLIATHPLSSEKGKWIIDPKHIMLKTSVKKKEKNSNPYKRKSPLPKPVIYTRGLNYYKKIIFGKI